MESACRRKSWLPISGCLWRRRAVCASPLCIHTTVDNFASPHSWWPCFCNILGWVVRLPMSGTKMRSHLGEQSFTRGQSSAEPDLISQVLLAAQVIFLWQDTILAGTFTILYSLAAYYDLIWSMDRVYDRCHFGWKILCHVLDKWKSIFHVQSRYAYVKIPNT